MIDELYVTISEMRSVVDLNDYEIVGGARQDGVCLDTTKRKDLGG
jgi:hypothetical protein